LRELIAMASAIANKTVTLEECARLQYKVCCITGVGIVTQILSQYEVYKKVSKLQGRLATMAPEDITHVFVLSHHKIIADCSLKRDHPGTAGEGS
jgi:hypothetical protein